jgi:hypothetical protein
MQASWIETAEDAPHGRRGIADALSLARTSLSTNILYRVIILLLPLVNSQIVAVCMAVLGLYAERAYQGHCDDEYLFLSVVHHFLPPAILLHSKPPVLIASHCTSK